VMCATTRDGLGSATGAPGVPGGRGGYTAPNVEHPEAITVAANIVTTTSALVISPGVLRMRALCTARTDAGTATRGTFRRLSEARARSARSGEAVSRHCPAKRSGPGACSSRASDRRGSNPGLLRAFDWLGTPRHVPCSRRCMSTLRAGWVLGFIGVLASLLAGCPDGAGIGSHGQDGGIEGGDDGGAAEAGRESASSAEGGALEASTEGGAANGSGALCGANGRNDCGPFLLCDEGLGCVECRHDDDCPAAATHCLEGTCVGCRPATTVADAGMSDCPAPSSTCWSTDDECHAPCSDTRPCPSGSACDNASGACVGCTTDADCPSGVCSAARRTCVDCVSDATCTASKPRCRILTGACEACTSSSDCGHAAPICDPSTFTCRVGCSSDAQCPGQRCDDVSATCVALSADAGLDAASGADADAAK
ncbi:MAG: putative lipoprotein, partial [Myxococcaceae bacterium]|nr:putative lipoprotein [Myxococcaceae bacterium]